MLCTGLFPNADTKIQHRRCPTCPLWYDKYQLCSIWLNYVYFCTFASGSRTGRNSRSSGSSTP